jgi:hypothetical protein
MKAFVIVVVATAAVLAAIAPAASAREAVAPELDRIERPVVTPNPRIRFGATPRSQPGFVTPNPRIRFGLAHRDLVSRLRALGLR